MKATELRIGNLVKSEQGAIHQVLNLYTANLSIAAFHDLEDECTPYYDNIFGIPLTEEWLVRFGFENNDGEFRKEHYRIKIEIHIEHKDDIRVNISDDVGDVYLKYAEYKYVHQLQNLYFALTGEELTYANK